MNDTAFTSTRPYLIRAIHEWCTDNGVTPYLAVRVDRSVQVPREFVNDGEIVLNVSYDATGSLQLGNDFISFKARFGGKPRDIMVPVERVLAIYARESGQGMSFPVVDDVAGEDEVPALHAVEAAEDDAPASLEADAAARSTLPEVPSRERDSRVVQLVPVSGGKSEEGPDGNPPPAPAPTGGARPALKRIK